MLIEIKDGVIPKLPKAFDVYQVYNCLDACITAQLLPTMLEQANENQLRTYDRMMRMQSLCLEMSTKGFPVTSSMGPLGKRPTRIFGPLKSAKIDSGRPARAAISRKILATTA